MYLKKNKNNLKKKKYPSIFFQIYFFFTIIFSIILFIIFLNTSFLKENKSKLIDKYYYSGINHYFNIIEIISKSLSSRINPKLSKISLNINQDKILILEKNRQDILNGKLIGSGDERFKTINAVLEIDNNKYDISIRIKGDRSQNFLEKNKVSYKIKIKKNKSFMNMRKFSLMKPRIRNYIHEWLFHEFSATQDLTKLKYEFVYLNVNGSSNGLYVVEENFDAWLIEKNKRRNGPIFSMREEFDENFMTSKFEIYNKNYWNKAENINLASKALYKLEMFQKNKTDLEKTFDLKKWAKYFAIIDLTYSFHGSSPRNVKFFFNPVSSLFEPIPYDGHRTHVNYNKNISNFDHTTLFEKSKLGMIPGRLYPKNKFNLSEDPETSLIRAFFYKNNGQPNKLFLKKYFNNIDEITEVNFLKNFFDERKKKIDQINSAIYADYFLIDNNFNNKYGPGYYYFSEEDIFTRAKILKKKIKPELSKINIKEDQNNIYLINKSSKNLILETVQFICEINNTSSNENKKILYKIELDLNIEQKIIKNNLFDNIHKCNSVDFSNLKKSKIYSKNISFFLNTILKKDTDFLQYFKISDNILTLANDEIIIEKDIIIPQNYTVKIKSGQKIKIINNSLILSHSPWEVNGETSKVKIVGDKNNFGGGIFIKNKNKISKFQNVKFEYLAGVEERIFHNPYPKDNKFVITSYRGVKKNDYKKNVIYLKSEEYMTSEFLKLTGAITIYMGKTIFDNCEFKKISSEDAINLIKTTSSLNNLSFDENSSDSIDIDFGIAKITNSKFKNIEGDGIDVSGSEVEINKINFYNISDKAISVGEESLANIKNIYGEKSFIGIAVKDGSHTNVSKVHFNNVQFPFASYQKKKFYNFPTIKINNEIMLENYTKKFLKDKDSTIIYKNETIKKYLDKILPFVYKAKDESTS